MLNNNVIVCTSKEELGQKAAQTGMAAIQKAVHDKGGANIILATGVSQFELLENLVTAEWDNWQKVTVFHLDEYMGIPISHPASFRRYLKERFADRVEVKAFHYINTEQDAEGECGRLGELITKHPIDVAFVGIGENGHLAFNDPPADFKTEKPYLIVQLDEACRRQQFGEGWFKHLEEVPKQALSMSIQQMMKARVIICSVSDQRKAQAVKNAIQGPVIPDVPASILQQHDRVTFFLDTASAALL